MLKANAKFSIGQVVRHRVHPFRGVIFDIDPTFDNTEEWWQSTDKSGDPVEHPEVEVLFGALSGDQYQFGSVLH